MTSDALSRQKAAFRKHASQRRKQAASELAESHAEVIASALWDAFDQLFLDPAAHIISGYLPIGSEIDVLPLLEALRRRGADICLPCVVEKDTPLVFRPWKPEDPLVDEAFGTKAPHPDLPTLVPSIMLVPLLAFDQTGRRMGYGGGFYDRTISLHRAQSKKPLTVIGCAFAAQQFDEIPGDALDQPMDAIITEAGAILISPQLA